ncbi:hypothetical protein [Rheinheimera sp.]|jgi:hypothetical protein|uniref:hypothetical protein n=1 Tax=Rheinheimera sp. TaxID=1869214 RepID=UPI003D28CCED
MYDKRMLKLLLCERLALAQVPFSRHGNQIRTARALVEFQEHSLVLVKTGKAERHLPYHKVRLSQLLLNLQPQGEFSA